MNSKLVTLGSLIRRAQQHHNSVWSSMLPSDATSVQFAALDAVSKDPGIGQKELCSAIDLDSSTVAELSARLERTGYLVRKSHDKDRRKYSLELTEFGEKEHLRLKPFVQHVQVAMASKLSDEEVAELMRLLEKLIA